MQRAPSDARAHEHACQSDQWLQRVPRLALPSAQEDRRKGRAHHCCRHLARGSLLLRCRERAALALTEAATRLNDRTDPVPEEIWREASKHYNEAALGALVMSIGLINLWNRLNAATRQVGGEWTAQYI